MNLKTFAWAALLLTATFAYADDPYVYDPTPAAASTVSAAASTDASNTSAAVPAAAAQPVSLNADQLNSLVAPIALYPDPILSQIFVASTYPLEVVQAQQWVAAHPELKGQDLTDAAAKESWDPSVQALVAFPDVLKRMSDDVTWTTNLGNAFLANQGEVMDAVQTLRIKAEDSGKLASTAQQKVTNTTDDGKKVVEVEPANPDVVYVPVYDPVWIWGAPYPGYPYPGWYYPAAPVGFFFIWGAPIYCSHFYFGWHSWAGWGWHPYWGSHTVIVNNTFIRSNHFNAVRNTTVVGGRTVWQHDPIHRQGVPYAHAAVRTRFAGAARFGGAAHPAGVPVNRSALNAHQVQTQLHQSATRVRTQANYERMGNRQISTTGYNRNHSAFSGMNQGAAARTHSQRGYSSLSHRTATAPHAATGGHAVGGHAAGGGGHAGGGGFGGGNGGGGGHH